LRLNPSRVELNGGGELLRATIQVTRFGQSHGQIDVRLHHPRIERDSLLEGFARGVEFSKPVERGPQDVVGRGRTGAQFDRAAELLDCIAAPSLDSIDLPQQ
jgi:hypothetical protein